MKIEREMKDYMKQIIDEGEEGKWDSHLGDIRELAQMQEIARKITMDRPKDQFGPLEEFIVGFFTPKMREGFSQVAEEFLHNEPLLQTNESKTLLERMHRPARKEQALEDPYFFAVLEMMVLCAQNGSAYSTELLLGLYKTYYKKEYNVLKRFHVLSLKDVSEFVQIEAQRRGLSDVEEYDLDPLDYPFADYVMGRLIIMGSLMNIELDQSWNGLIVSSNEDILKSHLIWKLLEYMPQEEQFLSQEIEQYTQQSATLDAEFPGVDWYLFDERVENIEDPNDLLSLCMHVIEKAMDDRFVHSGIFFEDNYELDLRDSAVNALIDIAEWVDPKESKDLVILFAVIRYLADILAALECQREEEMYEMLGFRYRELVTDDMLEESGLEESVLENFRMDQKGMPADAQISKLLSKAQKAGKGSSSLSGSGIKKHESTSQNAAAGKAPIKAAPMGDKDKTIEELKRELDEKSHQIQELKGKLREQRDAQEESKKREISLRAHMDEWKRDKTELITLRNFAHDLENEDIADTTPADVEMMTYLNSKKIMIIGGHENWIKKMKRLFPAWEFITRNAGLGITGAVKSCDQIYFYTDICGHSLYYRFLGLAAEYHKPYSYLHGTNTDRVIRHIYRDLTEGRR